MKVLFAVWEIAPFFKMGGLGDVAQSLPAALKELGVDVRVITPGYRVVHYDFSHAKPLLNTTVNYDREEESVSVFQVDHPTCHVPVYFVQNETYLDMADDEIDTFAFFDKAVVELVKTGSLGFTPDIIHCHDYHTGLIPLLIKDHRLPIKSILTIHNLAYQGRTGLHILDKLGISHRKSRVLGWEIKSRQVNMLMEGIIHADIATTVSPTYAREILKEEYGMGLDEVLRGKEGRVFGVLNGISVNLPADDRVAFRKDLTVSGSLPEAIDTNQLDTFLAKKREAKRALQKELGLIVSDELPLSCFIGRLDPGQKGLDIFHKMLRRIDLEHHEFVILGSGSPEWEQKFQWLCAFYPKHVSCTFTFNELLAWKMYAACDFIVIPSKFEPCGLIQMLAMYFGTIPIAHKTGGLIDSISHGINGFLFDRYTSLSLERAYNKAIYLRRSKKDEYLQMVSNALATDFSWGKSAGEYVRLYEKLLTL